MIRTKSVKALGLQGFLHNLLKGKKCRKRPFLGVFYHTIGVKKYL